MAYMSQEHKKELAPTIKKVLAKYGMKGTIGVRNHMSLVVKLKSGKLDLIGSANKTNTLNAEREGRAPYVIKDYFTVNHYHAADQAERVGDKKIASFYRELIAAMYGPKYFDESDIMTDYFHCSHYIDIDCGQWNKPYELTV